MDKVTVIRPDVPSVFPYSNSLLIDDGQKILIDAGAGRAYRDIACEQIDTVLLSHYHFDHIHGIPLFPRAKVYVGKEEEWAFKDEARFNEAGSYQYWSRLMGEVPVDRDYSAFPDDVLLAPGFHKLNISGVFSDREIIYTDSLKIKAVYIPGHTPGHYGFFLPDQGILFSSDMDLSPRGPWYGSIYSDFDQVRSSIQKLINLKPQVLVTSHRRVFYDNIPDLLNKYLDIALEKERKLLDYLKIPRYFEEIAHQDFIFTSPRRTLNSIFRDRIMLLKHLQSLIAHHKIKLNELQQYVRIE